MRIRHSAIAIVVAFTILPAANAHEFWLEASDYAPPPDEDIGLQILIGQRFSGSPFPYLEDRFFKFESRQSESINGVDGLDGDDNPTTKVSFHNPGLAVIAYHAKDNEMTHDTMEKFEDFLAKEGLERFLPEHRAANKPTKEIEERYYRTAKVLIDIGGTGQGEDSFTGMPLELVAERNPYSLGPGEAFPVRLLQGGAPVAGVLVKAFPKSDPKSVQRLWTDETGRVFIILPVSGPWLLSAVQFFPPEPDDWVDWVSIWASMTFERR